MHKKLLFRQNMHHRRWNKKFKMQFKIQEVQCNFYFQQMFQLNIKIHAKSLDHYFGVNFYTATHVLKQCVWHDKPNKGPIGKSHLTISPWRLHQISMFWTSNNIWWVIFNKFVYINSIFSIVKKFVISFMSKLSDSIVRAPENILNATRKNSSKYT